MLLKNLDKCALCDKDVHKSFPKKYDKVSRVSRSLNL